MENDESKKVLPCPFCGGKYIPNHPKMKNRIPCRSSPVLEELSGGGWRVCCYGCGVSTWDNLGYTVEQAVEAWNTRADETKEKIESFLNMLQHSKE